MRQMIVLPVMGTVKSEMENFKITAQNAIHMEYIQTTEDDSADQTSS